MIFEMDALSAIAEIKKLGKIVHSGVMSPPYLWKQDYGISKTIWDTKNIGCDHDFSGVVGLGHDLWKVNFKRSQSWRNKEICRNCGAWYGQLGHEPTPEMYIAHLVYIYTNFSEILRDDGTLWVVIGDTSISAKSRYSTKNDTFLGGGRNDAKLGNLQDGAKPDLAGHPYYRDGDLTNIPYMFADAMQKNGWSLRSNIIWYKEVHKPESVVGWQWDKHIVNGGECKGCSKCDNGLVLKRHNGRPTVCTENILLFSKNGARYYYNTDAIRIPNTSLDADNNPLGKNARNVWTINPIPNPIHHATFPYDLAEKCVLASTPPMCCADCGAPFARVHDGYYTVGWKKTCQCFGLSVPPIVADLFGGTGTTALASVRNGRDYIYIDPNKSFVDYAKERIGQG